MASVSDSNITITGVGLVSPLGLTADETWRSVLLSRDGMSNMPALEQPLPPGKNGGQAVDLPADFAPDLPREARYLKYAIDNALASAGMRDALPCHASRATIMLGTTLHGMRAGGRFLRNSSPEELQSFLAGDTLRLATAHLLIAGGAATTCSACSSSLGSIALGVTLLQTHQADLVIAGGYDTVSEYAWAGFNALRLVSEPPLRPFARLRVGMKLSEAYAIVILQRKEDAARPLAYISGWGESADAHHLTQPHPAGAGALAAMKQSLGRAQIPATALGLIAAHATGTPDNDSSEAAAIGSLLGEHVSSVPVVGFKSHLGHTLGGAGAAELILSLLALRNQIIPPTANVSPETTEYPINLTHARPSRGTIDHTLNTSLGFGGANTCIVLSRQARASARTEPRGVVITGVGVVLPQMVGNEAFAARVRAGARFDPDASLVDSDFEHLLNARRVRRMSAYVKMTLAAVAVAIADAKLAPGFDAAGMLGTTHGSAAYSHEYYGQVVREGLLAANPMLFAEGVPNAAAAQLSLMLGLKGACQTIIGTRTSGLDALRLASLRIASGACDRVIVSAGEESYVTVNNAYTHCGLRGPDGFTNFPGAVALILESETITTRAIARITDARTASGAKDDLIATASRATIGAPDIVTTDNRTWLGRCERAAIRRAATDARVTSFYDSTGELFSAHALVSIAAMLLARDARDFSILNTDYNGLATSVRIERV